MNKNVKNLIKIATKLSIVAVFVISANITFAQWNDYSAGYDWDYPDYSTGGWNDYSAGYDWDYTNFGIGNWDYYSGGYDHDVRDYGVGNWDYYSGGYNYGVRDYGVGNWDYYSGGYDHDVRDYGVGNWDYYSGDYDYRVSNFQSGNWDFDRVTCDSFTASDYYVEEGDRITLRWNTTDAEDVDIDNGVGDVDENGSERVRVYETTTFTLVARGNAGHDTCRLTVRVEDDGRVAGVSYTSDRYSDGIVLATTPYTGFDADSVLEYIFYIAIVFWALVIAYAVVLKKRNKVITQDLIVR